VTVQYTNRKRVTYYLHEDHTKTGDLRYFFSTKDEGNLVDTLPRGYEIYENPNSHVLLRRTEPRVITENETQAVEKYLNKLTAARRYIADIWKKDITLFESNEDIEVLKEVYRTGTPKGFSLEEAINFSVSFAPTLRFTLEDAGHRTFVLNRFIFQGGTDDEWRYIAGPDSLENLAKKYLMRLGTEAFDSTLLLP